MTLFFAMCLDAMLGEPRMIWNRVPHPAVLMGRVIDWADTRFNTGHGLRRKGVLTVMALVCAAALLGFVLEALPGNLIDIVVVAILIAQRSLSDHVLAVARALDTSLDAGRTAVAQIVGRDTDQMDTAAVSRSAIESAAENLSDGVVAPIFWFAIAGLPGILIYKIVNTADSMIGHRTPRHLLFGWAAARLDDLLNLIPARLTAAIILLVTWQFDMGQHVMDDAPQHRSPNAGWPEAATAHALNFALSGPRHYHGELHDEPFVNAAGIRELDQGHIREVTILLWKVWGALLLPALALGYLIVWI